MGMRKEIFCSSRFILITIVVIVSLCIGGSLILRESPNAFGGNFAPQMAQQAGPRYQIAGCDANSAWIIDTTMGDVYMMYSNGKWKEVGSIMDEKKRIKK
jgi:hypothetical protein